ILLGLVVLVAIWGGFGGDEPPTSGKRSDVAAEGTDKADAYLDTVARRLASPGLSIDPAVLKSGRMAPESFAPLDARVRAREAQVRLYVLPASKVRADKPVPGLPRRENLAYTPGELVAELHDRVNAPGVYAVLLDAGSVDGGRGFAATQYGDGPSYDVQGAVEHALNCCARDDRRLLSAFTDRVDRPAGGLGRIALKAIGVLAALAVLVAAAAAYRRRQGHHRHELEDLGAMREVLVTEAVELDAEAQAISDREDASWVTTDRMRRLKAEVGAAFAGATGLTEPGQADAVIAAIARAREQLAGIEALDRGEEPPRPGPPCFADPRHGPATAHTRFTPTGGSELSVPVCAACAAVGAPLVRKLPFEGVEVPYWTAGDLGRRYVDGYWREHPFPLPEVEDMRHGE
ncbi:MAG: hypothetical protein R2731_19690, partial [Nocardioides sp.]